MKLRKPCLMISLTSNLKQINKVTHLKREIMTVNYNLLGKRNQTLRVYSFNKLILTKETLSNKYLQNYPLQLKMMTINYYLANEKSKMIKRKYSIIMKII